MAIFGSQSRSHVFDAGLDQPLLLPPTQIKSFVLGYNEVVADGLWLRVVQDFDYCEHKVRGSTGLVACDNSWVYHMIDAITELSPRFKIPHITGALMLSVMVNDRAGASKIFDKTVARFPDDWAVLYYAGYHALYEEKNLEKASKLMAMAARQGAPGWTYSLAARLQQKAGKLTVAREILAHALESNPDDYTSGLLKKRLDEIDKQIAEDSKPGP